MNCNTVTFIHKFVLLSLCLFNEQITLGYLILQSLCKCGWAQLYYNNYNNDYNTSLYIEYSYFASVGGLSSTITIIIMIIILPCI